MVSYRCTKEAKSDLQRAAKSRGWSASDFADNAVQKASKHYLRRFGEKQNE